MSRVTNAEHYSNLISNQAEQQNDPIDSYTPDYNGWSIEGWRGAYSEDVPRRLLWVILAITSWLLFLVESIAYRLGSLDEGHPKAGVDLQSAPSE